MESSMNFDMSRLEELSHEQTEDFLRRASLTYLECCISLMLTHLPCDAVAEILEREARLVRDFD
jgi:hypothetical protein